MKRGRKRDIKSIEQILEYRAKNLSFREIARLTGRNVKNVYTAFRYVVPKAVDTPVDKAA